MPPFMSPLPSPFQLSSPKSFLPLILLFASSCCSNNATTTFHFVIVLHKGLKTFVARLVCTLLCIYRFVDVQFDLLRCLLFTLCDLEIGKLCLNR
jgi:hypothetical protein